jgi:hypothetical protein
MRLLLGPKITALIWIPCLLMSLAGCAKSSQELIIPGQSTYSDVKARLGEPEKVLTTPINTNAKIMAYPDGCRFQIEHNLVVGTACPPTAEERTLQYWRHKWIGSSPHLEEVPGSADPHGQKSYQLRSDQKQMSVVYEPGMDRVIWVVKYGSR